MLVTESTEIQIEDLLDKIAQSLELTGSQYERAKQSYQAIGEWLQAPNSTLVAARPQIYPQGSIAIGTTVRPIAKNEYDVDLVCEFDVDWTRVSNPVALLDSIEARLRDNETYRDLLRRKNRCIRVEYAGDFHLDILPACPNGAQGPGCVVVPDRKLQDWKHSNPRGFTRWFEDSTSQARSILMAEVEPLPSGEPREVKPPLKRAVQLWKPMRDVYYEDEPSVAPVSIVLTTLAGHFYDGESSAYEALRNIIDRTARAIPKSGRLVVRNPTNISEDLSDKWDDPKNYEAFLRGLRDWNIGIPGLRLEEGIGMIEAAAAFKPLFGGSQVNRAISMQASEFQGHREAQRAAVRSGTGRIIAVAETVRPVPRNTFYGQ